MVAGSHRTAMTVEEYLALDRASPNMRYEYIDGVLTIRPGGTIDHSSICVNIASELRTALRGKPCKVFGSDLKVSISKMRYVYPDVSVSCDQRDLKEKGAIIHDPRVIFEAEERRQKFTYYRNCPSVQEYVLVSTDEQAVDVYRRATEKLWSLHLFGPGDDVELKSIDVNIPIAAIYNKVSFEMY